MNQSKKNVSLAGIFAAFLFLIFFLLDQIFTVRRVPDTMGPLKPLATWTDDLVVGRGEFPHGLGNCSLQKVNDLYGLDRTYTFSGYGRDCYSGSSLSVRIKIYSTTLAAEQAYPYMLNIYLPSATIDNYKAMPELTIPDHANERKTACLDGSSFRQCRSTARYLDVIVQVDGDVYLDRFLTLSGFQQMLEAIDRRVAWVMSR